MATTHMALATLNTQVDAGAALLDGGTINFYTGSMPATPETAVTSQTLLGTVTFGATAFGSATGGVATANPITGDTSADDTGTVTWARLFQSDGTTAVADCDVTATGGGGAITVANTSIVSGQTIEVTSLTWTAPAGT
jgi:hypothetical protein